MYNGHYLLRENFFLVALVSVPLVVSKHKEVLARGVAVQVAVKQDVSRLQSAFHHQLGVVVNWVVLLGSGSPLPIQILAHKAAPIIAYNHSVRVLHGDDFKDELVAKESCSLFI